MKQSVIIAVLLFCCAVANAQYIFSGKIEYERKKNVWGLYQDEEWFEKYKATQQKFVSNFYDLVFDTAKSCYKPGREVENTPSWMSNSPASENIVYTDFTARRITANKTVFEQKFLIQDSMRRLTWKEKDEIRTIAGHQCHKAVAVICDTVYVVAFYTEDIPTSGGPEMFGGLPGMILELAIPRLHTTWTATKIDQNIPPESDFKIPEKGKKSTQKELMETVKESFNDWGTSGKLNILWTVL